MKITVERRSDIPVLHLEGELTGDEDNSLTDVVTDHVQGRGARAVLDLSGVKYINSAGIGDLVRVVAGANTQEQRIVLCSLTPFVEGVIQVTQLDRFFAITATVDEAIASLTT